MNKSVQELLLTVGAISCALFAANVGAHEGFTEIKNPNNQVGGGFGVDFGGLPDLTGDGVGEFYAYGGFGGMNCFVFDGNSLQVLYSFGASGCGAGWPMHSAGDLDGDGIPELMIGKGCDATGRGIVGVVNGATAAPLYTLNSPDPVTQGYFGTTLRLLPDMTGDGKDDWLIHQPEFQSRTGRVYIFDSQTREVARTIENTGAGYEFWMEFVEVIPDVDGDGKPELLLGTRVAEVTREGQTFTGAGRAAVRSLQTGAALYELLDPEPQTDGWFGYALSGIGDITGDGIADIAVGTFSKDNGAGAIYLFSGSDGRWQRTLRSPNPQSNGRFGRKIEPLPDLNGDGIPELWTQEDGAGLTHVFDGATSALLKSISYPGALPNLFFIGTVRQTAAPGIRAYLFASEFAANSDGRVYYMPFTPLPVPTPPEVRTLGFTNAGLRLQVTGRPGSTVEIHGSSDLVTWGLVAETTAGEEPLEVMDPAALQLPRRFYRAMEKE